MHNVNIRVNRRSSLKDPSQEIQDIITILNRNMTDCLQLLKSSDLTSSTSSVIHEYIFI